MISHRTEGLSDEFNRVDLGLVDDVVGLELLELGLDKTEREFNRVVLRRVWCVPYRIDLKLLHSIQSNFRSMDSKVIHEQEERPLFHLKSETLQEVTELRDVNRLAIVFP